MNDVPPEPSGPNQPKAARAPTRANPSTPIKKAVDALAIVPTKDKIYPLARKLYNVLLYFAQRQGQDELIYRAPLRELVRVVDFNSNNTEVIKNHLRQLVTTKVEWQSPTTGEGSRWSVSALISHCDLIIRGGELIIEWSYAPNIKLQLLDPQRYARISLVYQAALRSMAGLVLYEICTRYIDNPGGVTSRQPWQWWRPVLTGAPESSVDTYQEYKYFKRDVLKSAIAEINAVTNLDVELVEHRQGRAVVDIQFKVRQKEQPALPMQHLMPLDLETVAQAIKQGVSQEQAEQLITRHGEPVVAAGLKKLAARKAMRNLPPVENTGRFLAAVIRNRVDDEEPLASKTDTSQRAERSDTTRAALIERFRSNKRTELAALFRDLPTTDQENLQSRFAAERLSGLPSVLQRGYQRNGLQNPMVKAEFFRWFGDETWGIEWDQPTDSDLLAIITN